MALIYYLLSSVVIAQIPKTIYPKNITKNFIGVAFGLSDFHIRDEFASPLTYRGLGITADFKYSHNSSRNKHSVEFAAFYSKLKSGYESYYVRNFRLNFNYDYFYNLLFNKNSNNFNLFVGFGFQSFLNTSEYNITFYKNKMFRWMVVHSLEIASSVEYSFNADNNFQLRLSFPVISNVSRQQYSDIPDNSGLTEPIKLFGKTVFYTDNLILKLNINYIHKFNNWIKILFQYDFQSLSYNEPRRIIMFMNNFRLGTYFKF